MTSKSVADSTDEVALTETGLASVACDAALKIDDLIKGRSPKLDSVANLLKLIAHKIPPPNSQSVSKSMLDPTAVVMISQAMTSAGLAAATKMGDFLEQTQTVRGSLEQLVQHTSYFVEKHKNELEQLRSFCLALSKNAAVVELSDDPSSSEHPFRR